ncbi:MAG: hypothetical protein QXP55_05010 [Nitrososphaerales archaeon]
MSFSLPENKKEEEQIEDDVLNDLYALLPYIERNLNKKVKLVVTKHSEIVPIPTGDGNYIYALVAYGYDSKSGGIWRAIIKMLDEEAFGYTFEYKCRCLKCDSLIYLKGEGIWSLERFKYKVDFESKHLACQKRKLEP